MCNQLNVKVAKTNYYIIDNMYIFLPHNYINNETDNPFNYDKQKIKSVLNEN